MRQLWKPRVFAVMGIWFCPLVSPPFPAVGQDLGTEEITTTGTVDLFTWEPMITTFWVVPPVGANETPRTAPGSATPVTNLLGELSQWKALKPLLSPHWDKDGIPSLYGFDEPVYSGWRRVVSDDGQVTYEMNGPYVYDKASEKYAPVTDLKSVSPKEYCLDTIYSRAAHAQVNVGLDVLMNARDVGLKDQKVRNYFKLLELTITAHKVSRDPTKIREEVGSDPAFDADEKQEIRLRQIGSPDAREGVDFAGNSIVTADWDNRNPGVFEVRVKARVQGQFTMSDTPEVRTVRGTLRISFVEKKITIDRLFWQNVRKDQPKQPGRP